MFQDFYTRNIIYHNIINHLSVLNVIVCRLIDIRLSKSELLPPAMRQLYNIRSRRRSSSTPYLTERPEHRLFVRFAIQAKVIVSYSKFNSWWAGCRTMQRNEKMFSSFASYKITLLLNTNGAQRLETGTSVCLCCCSLFHPPMHINRGSFHRKILSAVQLHRRSSTKWINPATRTFDKGTFATNSIILCCISKFRHI